MMKQIGYKPSDQLSLEDEYKKIKEMDIDNWEQVRGPRPWEESFEEEKKWCNDGTDCQVAASY